MDQQLPASVGRLDASYASIDTELLDLSSVAASRARCVVHGLEPDTVPRPSILTGVEIQDHRDPLADLISLSQGEVQRLFELLAEQEYVLMLANSDGVALGFRSTDRMLAACSSAGVLPGSVWSEVDQGTNGVALCIREQRALSVVMQDHFAANLAGVSCTVAPVFGAHGALAGVLNVTTLRPTDRAAQAVVRQVVAASARRIENMYFDRRHARNAILRVSRHGDFCDAASEARVALDSSGVVLDATPLAQKILVPTGGSLVGFKLSELPGLQEWLRLANVRSGAAVELPNGRHFLRLEEPVVKSAPRTAVEPARSDLTRGVGSEYPCVQQIIGDDPAVRDAVAVAKRLIAHHVPAFLHGETGTGKSVLARALHMDVGGAPEKFVAINCAAITAELIESELFGYRPGAFTGASRQGSRGRLLEADGGTLFLDEIGDMPLLMQTRLLQVLSDGEFTPVGATRPVQVRFALIAASLHDVEELVRTGDFREDLYFRLAGATVRLPALRHRADLELLIDQAFASAARRVGQRPPIVEDAAKRVLMSHSWPGNLRELQHSARFAIAIDVDGRVSVGDLPPPLGSMREAESGRPAAGKATILAALERKQWNVSAAAASLGISRATLHRYVRDLGIERPARGDLLKSNSR